MFTAGFLQRHQTLGHSSRAQPASPEVSPVPGGERRAAHSGRAWKRRPGLKKGRGKELSGAVPGWELGDSGQLIQGSRGGTAYAQQGFLGGGLTQQPGDSKWATHLMR